MQARRIIDILPYQNYHFPNKRAFGHLKAGKKINFSSKETARLVHFMSCNLTDLGLKKGDYVCLFGSTTDSWWIITELAVLNAGGIIVPSEVGTNDFDMVINRLKKTKAKFCFSFNQDIFHHIQTFKEQLSNLKYLYDFDKHFKSLENHILFNNPSLEAKINIETLRGVIHEDDTAALIFTKGTTAEPKGILLSHKNIIANAQAFLKLSPLTCDHRHLSITHMAHSFERIVLVAVILSGASTFFQSGEENFYFATKRIKPHFLSMSTNNSDRFLKKLTDETKAAADFNAKLLKKAIDICSKNTNQLNPTFSEWFTLRLIDLFLFRKWRKKLGNKLLAIYVIGAPLNPSSAKLFYAAGIEIKEGYGLTECTALVSLNGYAAKTSLPNTSGKLMHNLKVKIEQNNEDEFGEILVKGPSVMKAYFEQQTNITSLITKEEWLQTGDYGKIIDNNFLVIKNREV